MKQTVTMSLLLKLCFFSAAICAVVGIAAEICTPEKCKLPDCNCASTKPPGGLSPKEIPQLVFLTFDDSIRIENIYYFREAFRHRKNPDGCPIGTTYFVSHEYTNYSLVHELWAEGQEIALHPHDFTLQNSGKYQKSLGNGDPAEYRELISKFANISKEDVLGNRWPFLNVGGDPGFEMVQKAGLKYDSSRRFGRRRIWPYTLDYKSPEVSLIPGFCPTNSFPGLWVIPVVNWEDDRGYPCSMVDSCIFVSDKEDEILDFMIRNFLRNYDVSNPTANRVPFGFYVHAAWFDKNPANYRAYLRFLDFLQSHDDVYIVSIQRGLQWVQNPSTLDNLKNSWPSCQQIHPNTCGGGKNCYIKKPDGTGRVINVCSESCPCHPDQNIP